MMPETPHSALISETLQTLTREARLLSAEAHLRQQQTLERLQLLVTDRAIPRAGGVWMDPADALLFLDATVRCVDRTLQAMLRAYTTSLRRVVAVRESLKRERATLAQKQEPRP